jgi:hypothetical protein
MLGGGMIVPRRLDCKRPHQSHEGRMGRAFARHFLRIFHQDDPEEHHRHRRSAETSAKPRAMEKASPFSIKI